MLVKATKAFKVVLRDSLSQNFHFSEPDSGCSLVRSGDGPLDANLLLPENQWINRSHHFNCNTSSGLSPSFTNLVLVPNTRQHMHLGQF